MKRVITYSLWFQNNPLDDYEHQTPNMYYNGVIANLRLLNDGGIYEGWTIRVYLDSTVPKKFHDELRSLGAEVIDMTGSQIPGMYWRFLVADDQEVDVFIVRDTDSRISKREEAAVSAWLDSDKLLHVMRDHPHHKYKILGGMWGCKNYADTDRIYRMEWLIDYFLLKRNYEFKRMDDMTFLNQIYDIYADNGAVMEHDSFFRHRFANAMPFPSQCSVDNGYYHYVGEIYDEYGNNPFQARDRKLFMRNR